jgi:class 3 adenylate cyclase/pimeloyl-ACP methyl ester carboxylesterase
LIALVYMDMVAFSRLMSLDDVGTLRRLQSLRYDLIDPAIEEHGGRLVNTGGDSLLIAFDSVESAVRYALKVQEQVPIREKDQLEERAIRFRVGVNIGDTIAEGGDLYGDAVNVAARLQAESPPGGICVSRSVRDHVHGRLGLEFEELGSLELKNIARPVEAFVLRRDVHPNPANLALDGRRTASRGTVTESRQGPIRYCRASDGVRLAYRMVGEGPLMVRAGAFLSHIEYDWTCFGHIYGGLAKTHTLLRYDVRGNGASDWDAPEISFDAWVRDLETVVDAAEADHFVLLGMSQGCAVSIAYAVKHPERVSHLILYGGYALGEMKRAATEEEREKVRSIVTLARLGWNDENSAYRQIFTSRMLSDATKERMDAYNEFLRKAASPECAARYHVARGEIDVRDLLGRVTVPTLVMHMRDDAMQSVNLGRSMAQGIPGARFVSLEGRNHVFGPSEPAAQRFFEEIELFLGR